MTTSRALFVKFSKKAEPVNFAQVAAYRDDRHTANGLEQGLWHKADESVVFIKAPYRVRLTDGREGYILYVA